MENTCNCGDTRMIYYPDENQHEPACWECYHSQFQNPTVCSDSNNDSQAVLDPDEWPF